MFYECQKYCNFLVGLWNADCSSQVFLCPQVILYFGTDTTFTWFPLKPLVTITLRQWAALLKGSNLIAYFAMHACSKRVFFNLWGSKHVVNSFFREIIWHMSAELDNQY